MRSHSIKFIYLFFIFLSSGMWGQNTSDAQIIGRVSSLTGENLTGVSLILQGTSKGAISNIDGTFEIRQITPGNYTLQVSYLGFEPLEREITLTPGQVLELNLVMEEKNEGLGSVTVLGRSVTGQVNEQAYMVTAISTKELYNSTADAQQVLDRVSGVRILQDGGLGSDVSFTLNGFSGDQVKFFLDGIPMDHFGSALDLSNIPVNSIDRIEVYKGVVPVWLGTDALGGAVNIITNQGANFLDASYSAGSFNTHRASVNGAFTRPESGFTFRGNINYNYSDNGYKVWEPIREGNDIVYTAEVERFHDRYRSASAKIETGLVNRKFADQLLLGELAATNDKQVQHGATMTSVNGGIVQNSSTMVPTLKYSKKDLFAPGLDISLYSAYNVTKSEVIDTLSGVTYNWLGEPSLIPGSEDGEVRRTFTSIDDDDFSSRLNAGYEINEEHSIALTYSYQHFAREVFDTENPDQI